MRPSNSDHSLRLSHQLSHQDLVKQTINKNIVITKKTLTLTPKVPAQFPIREIIFPTRAQTTIVTKAIKIKHNKPYYRLKLKPQIYQPFLLQSMKTERQDGEKPTKQLRKIVISDFIPRPINNSNSNFFVRPKKERTETIKMPCANNSSIKLNQESVQILDQIEPVQDEVICTPGNILKPRKYKRGCKSVRISQQLPTPKIFSFDDIIPSRQPAKSTTMTPKSTIKRALRQSNPTPIPPTSQPLDYVITARPKVHNQAIQIEHMKQMIVESRQLRSIEWALKYIKLEDVPVEAEQSHLFQKQDTVNNFVKFKQRQQRMHQKQQKSLVLDGEQFLTWVGQL